MQQTHVSKGITLILLAVLTVPAVGAKLKQKTVEAFDRYTQLTEGRIARELHDGPFLWIDSLAARERDGIYQRLRKGEVVMDRLHTEDSGKGVNVPDGMIHHWIGTAFIPGANLKQTVALMQDYNEHYKIYKPDVLRSKLLSHNGNDFKVYLRFHKKKVITVVMDTEHDARFFPVDATHLYSRSYATRINEVENPGESDERQKPAGDDGGFMWRLNSYWRLQEKDGGVYVQCEAVSLTRDIPVALKWMIAPFITSIPRESLYNTLNSTRLGVLGRMEGHATAAVKH